MSNNGQILESDVNVYEELYNVLISKDAEIKKYFIMSYYQTIPRYYLLCNDRDINSCIYNFSVGSGKTAAALFVILNNVDLYKKYSFNKQFMPKRISENTNMEINKNVFVIGSWVTVSAVMNELMREEFGFVNKKDIKEYKELLASDIIDDRKRGEKKRQDIQNKIQKYINFYGYQAFVNACFPTLSANSISQDAKVLIDNYRNGILQIDNDFKNKLRNSIVIIDECQKLYSINGMNSYGFTVMCINKLASELNIKMVFLSGTIFNTSLSELVPVVNIMCEHKDDKFESFDTDKGIFDDTDCLETIEIIPGVSIQAPTKKFLSVADKLLADRYILYDHSKYKTTVKYVPELTIPKHITVGSTPKIVADKIVDLKISNNLPISKNILYLIYPLRDRLPQEIHVGNLIVADRNNKEIKMLLYSCEVYGVQKEQYAKFLKSNSSNTIDMDDDENESSISIHDVGLPPTSEFIKRGIIKNRDEYIGKFLEAENLKNYSTIGYHLVNICKEKTVKEHQKVIVYHNKLRSFGIYQYMLILNANGFVKYGESPKSNSICRYCGMTYSQHNESLEERVKNRICNSFTPIYYYYLIGDMKQSEREEIVDSVFNSPKNIRGELLSIMFVSDVAYSGVSFLNTQNIILLSKISNISKWRQICARIIRTHSHSGLPITQRFAKVYTMVIHYPNEKEVFKTHYTHEHKYYIVRTILNENIDEYINDLDIKTIGYKLFNTPTEIQSSETEKRNLIEMYSSDVKKNISDIIDKYISDEPSKIWLLNNFIERLKDNKSTYTFINLSKISNEFLITILASNKRANMFRYNSDNTNAVYIKFASKKIKESTAMTTFTYRDVESIPKDKTVFYTMLTKLERTEFLTQKRTIMTEILKFVGNDYKMLVNQNIFWQTIFDIHDEYYIDDETNFVFNHQSENRSFGKMAGFYNNELIVMKDGTTKRIGMSFPTYTGWKNIPYKFRITCLALSSSSPFYLHVNISKKQDEQEDGRKVSKGVTCVSFDFRELLKYFGLNKDEYNNKADACLVLMQKLIDKQAENIEDRNLYTPFEK